MSRHKQDHYGTNLLQSKIRDDELVVSMPPIPATDRWMVILSDGYTTRLYKNPGEALALIFYGCLALETANPAEFRITTKGCDLVDLYRVR